MPPLQFRLRQGDLIRESETTIGQQENIEANFTVLDDYQNNVDMRNIQLQEAKNIHDDDNDDEDDEIESSTGSSAYNHNPSAAPGVSIRNY